MFANESLVINQPNPVNETQYETTINYICPSSSVRQYEVDVLRSNFTFDFSTANNASTYAQHIEAYCELNR